jgi:predicted RecB family endonuclease
MNKAKDKEKEVLEIINQLDFDFSDPKNLEKISKKGIDPESLRSWVAIYKAGGRLALESPAESTALHRTITLASLGLLGVIIALELMFAVENLPVEQAAVFRFLFPLLAGCAVLAVALVNEKKLAERVGVHLKLLDSVAYAMHKDVKNLLETKLAPAIISLHTEGDVLSTARRLLESALQEEDPEKKQVTYVGAPDLSRFLLPKKNQTESSPQQDELRGVLRRLQTESIRKIRFVQLLAKEDFLSRHKDTQRDYLEWLEKRADEMDTNPKHYEFNVTPRAPKWRDGRSSIFVGDSCIEIIGDARAGYLVRGEQIVRDTLSNTTGFYHDAKKNRPERVNAAYLYAEVKTLRELQKSKTKDAKAKTETPEGSDV